MKGLRVLAWSSSSQLRGREEETHRTARELGADHLLVGSVRRAGGRVRIAARLVQTASGYYVWSEAYDRELVDLFAVQEEIARAIARTLEGTLSPRQRPSVAPGRVDAYDFYLRGRYLWNQRTTEALEQSVECFGRALVLDEGFALAHAGLADAYGLLAQFGVMAPAAAVPLARAAALRALELDPRSSEAHASHAMIGVVVPTGSGTRPRRSTGGRSSATPATPPPTTGSRSTCSRWSDGSPRRTRRSNSPASSIPLSLSIMEGKPYLLMLEHRYDEALEGYHGVVELDPRYARSYTGMGRTYLQMGRLTEGVAMLQKGRELAGDTAGVLGALGQAAAWAGDLEEARRSLATLRSMGESRYVPCTTFALVHSALGERQTAIDWLERAAERRDLPLSLIGVHPAYDALRQEPRFAALLMRLRLRFPAA